MVACCAYAIEAEPTMVEVKNRKANACFIGYSPLRFLWYFSRIAWILIAFIVALGLIFVVAAWVLQVPMSRPSEKATARG
jgi:hypothetical protein